MIHVIEYKDVKINILRLDILQPIIQGNKFFKLKYNLLEAKKKNLETLLTFGGEYSNHIDATAKAGLYHNFKTIGIIRGNIPTKHTFTIQNAMKNKMEIFYLNRTAYRIARKLINNKCFDDFYDLLAKNNVNIDRFTTYIIPEGGTNLLALRGTKEILNYADKCSYQTVCCAVGTAGTIAGIIASIDASKKVIGFPALKGNFFEKEIKTLLQDFDSQKYLNWSLNHDYHLKGFGAYNDELIAFINMFYHKYDIPLCTLYTGKMFFGIFDLIDKGIFSNKDNILAIHTGGLQGRKAFNEKNGNLLIL